MTMTATEMKLKTLTVLAVALLLAACQSSNQTTSKVSADSKTRAGQRVESATLDLKDGDGVKLETLQITSVGDNVRPAFSADGKRVLFISRNRVNHANSQLYEFNLESKTERRLTFHDGDVQSASYTRDPSIIIYSSSTDEIKEGPFVVENLKNRLQVKAKEDKNPVAVVGPEVFRNWPLGDTGPSELYRARLDGSEIRRLTRSPGFDGDVTATRKDDTVIFIGLRSGQQNIQAFRFTSGSTRGLTRNQSQKRFASVSTNGLGLVWTDFDFSKKPDATELFMADARTMSGFSMLLPAGLHVTPTWHPNNEEIVWSAKLKASFNLFWSDRRGSCIKPVTQSASDQFFPALSPDGKKLAFVDASSGTYQIYISEFRLPKNCINPPAPQPVQPSQ